MSSDVYVLDTNVLSELRSYYPSRFPSFWRQFDDLVTAGKVISVREVRKELEGRPHPEWLDEWVKQKSGLFHAPSPAETAFVGKIFSIPQFQALVGAKAILRGTPAADPFVIAAAKVRGGCVVTQEHGKPNAAKIPNVCKHFGIRCLDFEGFMNDKGWSF